MEEHYPCPEEPPPMSSGNTTPCVAWAAAPGCSAESYFVRVNMAALFLLMRFP